MKLLIASALTMLTITSTHAMGSKRMKTPDPTSQKVEHIVVIGVDGLGGHNLDHKTLNGKVPNIMALRSKSAWTHKAAIDLYALSGPNWAAMQTASRSSYHKVLNNECHRGRGINTIFDQIKAHRPELLTAAVGVWDKFMCYSKEGSIDIKIKPKSDSETTKEVVKLINEKAPHYLFVHYDDVDHYGHSSGKGNTPEYNKAVIATDKAIGTIVQALKDRGIYEDTLIIFVADHGHGLIAGGHSSGLHPVPLYFHNKNFKYGEMIRKAIPSKQLRINLVAPISAFMLGIPDAKEWQYSSKAVQKYIK